MVIQTQYGLCNNVDLEHMKPYLGGLVPFSCRRWF